MSQVLSVNNFRFPEDKVTRDQVFSLNSFGSTLKLPEYVTHAGHFSIPDPTIVNATSPAVTTLQMSSRHLNREFFETTGNSTLITINAPGGNGFDDSVFGSSYEIWVINNTATTKTVTFNFNGTAVWFAGDTDNIVTNGHTVVYSVLPFTVGGTCTKYFIGASRYY